MDPSSGFGATGISKSELKNQELVVGASGFEPETSCAQGRRATRLRYAPTVAGNDSTAFFDFLFLERAAGFQSSSETCLAGTERAAGFLNLPRFNFAF